MRRNASIAAVCGVLVSGLGVLRPPLLAAPADVVSKVFPSGRTDAINIINWNANDLPKLYERSEQLPLTGEGIQKLTRAGFKAAQIVKMIEERRCVCDVSEEAMVALKKSGVSPDVIMAMSLHALPPNRAVTLAVTLDFTGEGREARDNYLYFFVEDGDVTRVFSLDISGMLKSQNRHESMVDKSDILLTRKVRRVEFFGDLPLKTYGKHRVLVVASPRPTLGHPSELSAPELAKAQEYELDYPRASLTNVCRLHGGYKRDAALSYKWNFVGSRFECEWN